ncbi:MAG: hypothetical protein U9R19_14865 [Bacteroidota bacterium]|nr:hypothetical protein [Bacteroidota bacterium]
MGKFILKSISVIFHPLLLPVFGLLIIFNSGSYHSYLNFEVKRIIFLVYFVSTVLLPLSVFPFLFYRRIIKKWVITDHKEKVLPILVVSAFHFFAWYMISRYSIPPLYKSFIFFSALGSLVAGILSTKINISLHLLAFGGLVGFTLALAFSKMLDLHVILMAMFLTAGLLAFSRLALNRSKPGTIYLSFILGLIMLFIPVYYF